MMASSVSVLSQRSYVLRKLPHITALFWIMKIVAVTLGETDRTHRPGDQGSPGRLRTARRTSRNSR